MATAIYIKPMTWAGKLEFFVGLQPSNPAADPCNRLGSYFIRTCRFESAKAIADHEAARLGVDVVTCEHYVGL